MRTLSVTIAFLALLSLTACKKDGSSSNSTKKDLISRNWKITALTGTFPPLPTIDLYAQMSACEKDNILKISSNGTYVFDEGATKCVSTDPQIIESGNWSFNSTETKVTIGSDTYDIISLSATTLVISQAVAADPVGGTPAGTINGTLTAQ